MRALMLLLPFALASCAAVKDAQMSAGETLDGPTTHKHSWGRVECGHGQVCAEVTVARVDVHRIEPDGSIEVTLQNRALEDVAVQVQLEIFDDKGRRVDRTGFHDVALAARQQSVLTLWQGVDEGDQIVVRLRARS